MGSCLASLGYLLGVKEKREREGKGVRLFSSGFVLLVLGWLKHRVTRYNGGVGVVLVVPVSLSFVSRFPAVGFSGSRSLPSQSAIALRSVAALVSPSAVVSVGCARGADSLARSLFPHAHVFSVASGRWGSGRGAFARRSVACVSSVAPAGLWCFFPAGPCPAGLLPSPSSSRCFCGLGSGSWASAAFALGSGLAVLCFLPPGVPCPVGWGFTSLGGGWWVSRPSSSSPAPPSQSSLF